jgi:hypothetical protein
MPQMPTKKKILRQTFTTATSSNAGPTKHSCSCRPIGPDAWGRKIDAFTKYAFVTVVENKEAETVAKAILSEWFCKFGIPAQIHTDGGKEFVNKLPNELFTLLNVQHTKTTPAHPQCNAQVKSLTKQLKCT